MTQRNGTDFYDEILKKFTAKARRFGVDKSQCFNINNVNMERRSIFQDDLHHAMQKSYIFKCGAKPALVRTGPLYIIFRH